MSLQPRWSSVSSSALDSFFSDKQDFQSSCLFFPENYIAIVVSHCCTYCYIRMRTRANYSKYIEGKKAATQLRRGHYEMQNEAVTYFLQRALFRFQLCVVPPDSQALSFLWASGLWRSRLFLHQGCKWKHSSCFWGMIRPRFCFLCILDDSHISSIQCCGSLRLPLFLALKSHHYLFSDLP